MELRGRDSFASYVKSVESSLKELKDRIILSRSSTSREDFTLHLPHTLVDVSGPEWSTGGPEIAACQTLVRSFLEVYQLACSKLASLEREISSYQSHITALKAELQDACLRENQTYVPVSSRFTPSVSSLLITSSDWKKISSYFTQQTHRGSQGSGTGI
uniref:Uncharacterized protein n=1 Tax=Pygocentrus nattereri TaxID=42514 RepID=A0AAR2K9C2_PYGNA